MNLDCDVLILQAGDDKPRTVYARDGHGNRFPIVIGPVPKEWKGKAKLNLKTYKSKTEISIKGG